MLAWPEPHQELTGALPERYLPIDIDRSPWDVFSDPFGLGTDDSWGIEMSQIDRPRDVSPSQAGTVPEARTKSTTGTLPMEAQGFATSGRKVGGFACVSQRLGADFWGCSLSPSGNHGVWGASRL